MARSSGWTSFALMFVAWDTIYLPASVPLSHIILLNLYISLQTFLMEYAADRRTV